MKRIIAWFRSARQEARIRGWRNLRESRGVSVGRYITCRVGNHGVVQGGQWTYVMKLRDGYRNTWDPVSRHDSYSVACNWVNLFGRSDNVQLMAKRHSACNVTESS